MDPALRNRIDSRLFGDEAEVVHDLSQRVLGQELARAEVDHERERLVGFAGHP